MRGDVAAINQRLSHAQLSRLNVWILTGEGDDLLEGNLDIFDVNAAAVVDLYSNVNHLVRHEATLRDHRCHVESLRAEIKGELLRGDFQHWSGQWRIEGI